MRFLSSADQRSHTGLGDTVRQTLLLLDDAYAEGRTDRMIEWRLLNKQQPVSVSLLHQPKI